MQSRASLANIAQFLLRRSATESEFERLLQSRPDLDDEDRAYIRAWKIAKSSGDAVDHPDDWRKVPRGKPEQTAKKRRIIRDPRGLS